MIGDANEDCQICGIGYYSKEGVCEECSKIGATNDCDPTTGAVNKEEGCLPGYYKDGNEDCTIIETEKSFYCYDAINFNGKTINVYETEVL